ALTNLVENGIRYSAENGNGPRVELIAGVDKSADRPFLNIVDFGAGVDPDLAEKLFQPFTTTAIKGTGLGLYISRELCEANQAQLSYFPQPQSETQHEGSVNKGSVFRILFAHPDRITS
ncbi:MAG: ATP-binding protein, partial [Pseudomonadota bacterium]